MVQYPVWGAVGWDIHFEARSRRIPLLTPLAATSASHLLGIHAMQTTGSPGLFFTLLDSRSAHVTAAFHTRYPRALLYEIKRTTDPGRALISGLWKDIGRMKGPILRGLAAPGALFPQRIRGFPEQCRRVLR